MNAFFFQPTKKFIYSVGLILREGIENVLWAFIG